MFKSFYTDAFEYLLCKAMAPITPTPRDIENCQRKRHYSYSHEADRVVKRTLEQNPFGSRNLHTYKCPHCEAMGKKAWIVGHKPIFEGEV